MSTELQPAGDNAEAVIEKTNAEVDTAKAPGIIKIVKTIAWLILIGGALGAFEIYDSIGKITFEVGYNYNPYGIMLAVGTFVSAVVVWAILTLMALNSENLYFIRYDLYYKNNKE